MFFCFAVELFHKYLKSIDRSPETIRSYMVELRAVTNFLETKYNCQPYLEDVCSLDLEDYLYVLKAGGKSNAGRSRVVYILRSFYNFLCKQGLADRNIASKIIPVKIELKERVYITEIEIEELVRAIENKIIKVLVSTLFMTGMRINEALNLTLKDVNLKQNVIYIKHGKGNKSRIIPINEKLHKIFVEYLDGIRSDISGKRFFATKQSGKLT